MSSKRKGSLLNRVLGKGKENDEEGGGKKEKKGKKGAKLEKMPSVRESFQSERAPSMRSVTHASEAQMHYEDHDGGYDEHRGGPIHYEEHHGAPVTAVHEDDDGPYRPFGDGDSAGRPSMINVHPAPSTHGGGGYFDNRFQDSPRNTIIRASVAYDHHPFDHAEGGHGGHGGGGFGMAHEPEHMHATATSSDMSRHPSQTVVGPNGSTEPSRMLKPGDQMEIDPRNPPTFVIDEGVTLEIGDEINGFIPYEQYLAELAAKPPPKTGGTYIVQGGGDVVIQDETGKVIRTIPGTGAMAGRGEPKIYEVNGSTIVVL